MGVPQSKLYPEEWTPHLVGVDDHPQGVDSLTKVTSLNDGQFAKSGTPGSGHSGL